jgi:hypothetical protein
MGCLLTARCVSHRGAANRSLSGVKPKSRDHRQSVVRDPQRHFATINYRIAKGLFDNLVGGGKQGLRNG